MSQLLTGKLWAYWWASLRMGRRAQGLPLTQGTTIRDVCDPTVICYRSLLSHHVFKPTHVKFGKAPLL